MQFGQAMRGYNEHFFRIQISGVFDTSTKVTARNLYEKMMSVDFVLSMMFMKNIVQMTKELQAEELQAELQAEHSGCML